MFKPITINNLNDDDSRADIFAARAAIVKSIHEKNLAQAFTHDYLVNDTDAEKLQEMFSPIIIHQSVDDRKRLRFSSHPILAVLNQYCNHDAAEQISRLKRAGITTGSIGDNVKCPLDADHNCLLVNDVDNAARIASNATNAATAGYKDFARFRERTPLCVRGAQSCSVQYSHAFAVHSCYDITARQLADIFIQHNIDQMTVYMYMFASLYDKDFRNLDSMYFNVRDVGDKYLFTLHDFARPYLHSKKTWNFWARFTTIDCDNFRIARETVRTIGPLHIISLTRVAKFPGKIYMNAPLNAMCGSYYKVPSILQAARGGFIARQRELKHYLVPSHVIEGAMSYSARMDNEAYKFVEFMTVISGYTRRLRIGNITYYDAWHPNTDELQDVVISLFIIGAAYRTERTKVISAAFKHMKTYMDGGFFYEIRTHFLRIFTNAKPDIDFNEDTHQLWSYRPYKARDATWSSSWEIVGRKYVERLVVEGDDEFKVDPELLDDDGDTDSIGSASDLLTLSQSAVTTVDIPSTISEEDSRSTISETNSEFLRQHAGSLLEDESDAEHFASIVQPNAVNGRSANVPAAIPPIVVPPTNVPPADTISVNTTDDTNSCASSINFLAAPRNPTINNNDDGIIAASTSVRFSRTFLGGHCAIQSVWTQLPQHNRPRQSHMLRDTFIALIGHMRRAGSRAPYTFDQVKNYIEKGDWNTNVSTFVFEVLSPIYNLTILLHGTSPNPVQIGNGAHMISIYYSNNHFSAVPTGGKRDKYGDIIQDHISRYFLLPSAPEISTIVDVSAAPGCLAAMAADAYPEAIVFAFVYDGHKALAFDTQFNRSNLKVFHYRDVKSLGKLMARVMKQRKYIDVLISDAAREQNSEAVVDDIVDCVRPFAKDICSIIFKAFSNPRKLWHLMADHFHGDYSQQYVESNTETYYFGFWNKSDEFDSDSLKGFDGHLSSTFDDLYSRYATRETTHVAYAEVAKVRQFLKEWTAGRAFAAVATDCGQILDKFNGKRIKVAFTAITGYASASKTTDAYKQYPDRVYVAPTRELCNRHTVSGRVSYTQHKVFEMRDASRVCGFVVDECEALPLEYYALLTLKYSKPIVVLGDMYQVGLFERGTRFTHLADVGVTNNIRDTYKIPKDIAGMLNKKFNFDIIAHSTVEKGLRLCSNFATIAKDVKKICFNSSTRDELVRKGHNASTITTYCGSRDDVVVFYVDSKAVTSQLTARPEYIYTAVTRAREQLVLTGEASGMIKSYFMLSGTTVDTYSEVSEVFVHADIDIPDQTQVELSSLSSLAEDCPVNVPAVIDVIEQEFIAENPATANHIAIAPNDIITDCAGMMTTPIDAAVSRDLTYKGLKVEPEVAFVKNQISSSSKMTIATAARRYLKALPIISKENRHVFAGDLAVGLSRAIFSNDHSFRKLCSLLRPTEGELSHHYREYIKALQVKLNHNSAALRELTEFDEFGETLSFFNKQQSKFDGKDSFDTSDKVGQGVAATSKRVNCLFSAYARYILTKMRDIIRNYNRPIILNTHDNDKQFNMEYTAIIEGAPESNSWACNDFSEWDSSYRSSHTDVMWSLMVAAGCPAYLATWFSKFREHWVMVYHSREGTVKFSSTEKQFSGNPFTICENTIMNMAMCFSIFSYRNMHAALFRGDDSAINCSSASMRTRGKDMIAKFGHGLKFHTYTVGEFAGWFLTPTGLFPDVLRYACKLFKLYRNKEHFDEALTSLKQRVSVVTNENQLRYGILCATEHYKNLSSEQVRVLFNFVRYSEKITYDMLKELKLPIAFA